MELDRAEAIVKQLIAPKYLNSAQKMVFGAAWNGQSYRTLAAETGYEYHYVKTIGAQIWKILQVATGSDVRKSNFREIISSFQVPLLPIVEIDLAQVSVGIDWGEAMPHNGDYVNDVAAFYGREQERNELYHWIVTDRCQIVTILGMGGMGKTTIAFKLLRTLQPQTKPIAAPDLARFSHIIWRSLLNAPPLKELLPDLIRTLMIAPSVTSAIDLVATIRQPPSIEAEATTQSRHQLHLELIPKTVVGQIELLLKICQKHRCLIVLDNVESIFQAGAQIGQYRSGCADYSDLFNQLGQINHQSCLLLTSREKPTEISQLEEINAKVRTLLLPGLNAIAGQQIFADRGCLPIPPLEWAEIDRYCGGNPLAFQLIAATVQEVADGDVSEIFPHLQSSKLGFADIHILLEQQWDRLTREEHQVMYWLAISREPMPMIELETALTPGWNHHDQPQQTPVNSCLLTVLQSLHRRSIIFSQAGKIEPDQRYWSLQPMVMEYVTDRFVDQICTEIEQQQPVWLNTHPISQATTKEYLRQAQLRLIVQPTIDRLRMNIGNPQQIGTHLRVMLARWKRNHPLYPGYLTGNLLNLFSHLDLDLTNLDCSESIVQQAYLVGIDLAQVNFTNAQMIDCAFTQTFSSVLAIAYSPDGRTLAASDSNGEIRLWSVRDGQCLLTCLGHTNWVRAIKFSPDGQYLASSSDDRTIKLWDLEAGTCFKTISAGIHSLGFDFSPDGRYLASGSANNSIYYWDLQTGICVREFTGHQDWSIDVKFHPQGHQFVSAGADRTVRVWDVASGRCHQIFQGHQNWVTTVDYSPDGQIILSGSLDCTLRLWDATEKINPILPASQNCLLILTGHGDEIWSATFSPGGTMFASAGIGGLLRVWRTVDGHCLHALEGHSKRLWSVAFHPDGDCLASGGEDQTIRFWQLSDGKCLQTLNGYTNWFRSIAWSPDGQRLITASHDRQIRMWLGDSETCFQALLGHTKSTLAVAADPQGLTFASGSDDHTIRIWDPRTLACTQILRAHTGGILALVYSPDGKYLVSAGSDLSVRIWDTRRWKCLQVLTGHTDRIGGLAYHPNLDLIASAGEDRTIRIWQLHEQTPMRILSQHTNRAIAVAFDPRGKILASGGIDRQILLWNIETGDLCQTLTGHAGWILSLAYSPDGKWLFSGASDDTISVWSTETGLCTRTLIGHQSWVWSVAVSGCGRFLASASEDATIRIWDVATGSPISTRRAYLPYEGMNITGIKGLTKAQINALKTLGAK